MKEFTLKTFSVCKIIDILDYFFQYLENALSKVLSQGITSIIIYIKGQKNLLSDKYLLFFYI